MTFDYFSKNRVTYILTKLKTILDSKAVPDDIKNGKLTIQKNGTNVQTFTANQSSNATANITVPTKTSELTNDSGFITNAGVTGAKGNSETTYRTGNVNITAANIGLGNVGNFKAVSTVASQGLTDTEKSNARTNIGAGTSNFSGAYADLTGKPTIPTVNNATLTIQKNGTNVQTFTANQASNATANITVPTKVSELTNDSGYTTNVGTITGIKMNGASKGTSGVVDLGTVITAHQDISGKANTADLGDGAYKNSGVYYGTCATAAATKDKVVSVSTDQKFTLKVGAVVHVKFTNSNSYSATADNKITLNVNSTGAKNIYYGTGYPTGTNTTAFGAANWYMSYMYNGTDWVWVGLSGENNTTYSAMSSSELTTGTATSLRTVRADYLKTGINSLIDTKINALDVTGASGISASKTISAWSETDGKVSITTQDISITKSQVSDFPTSMTPTSHTHGNIQNGGTLQTNDITIASGDKLVVTDSSDSNKVARTSISFDGSTATKALTQKGTWESFTNNAGTITGIKMNGASKGTSGVVDLGTVITAHQDISGKADKSATVSTVAWDSTNKKITKTINGTTSDVVTAATILGNLTKSQVTTALGYTPPTSDTNTHRPIQVNGTEVLGNNTTALNLKAGTNVSLSESSGTVTIAATDTNTWRGIQDNLTSDSTTESLSAKQGKNLANGSARDSTKLPLSGGQLTNVLTLYREGTTANNYPAQLKFKVKDTTTGQTYDSGYIAAYQDHGSTTYGTNMVVQSGGGMFLGSGEAPANHYAAKGASYSGEDTFITADGTLHLQSNGNGIANRKGFIVSTTGNLIPEAADTTGNGMGGIGSSTNRIKDVYTQSFNELLTGSGTAAQDKGSGVSPRYFPAKWTFNIGRAPVDGDIITIKIPVAGHDYGVFVSINNGTNYHPVRFDYGTSRLTTQFGNGQYITLVYTPNATVNNVYAVAGADARSNITGCWTVLNQYNTNTDVRPSAYCDTAAGTAAKVASCTGYSLLANSYIHVIIVNTNTYAGAITLNINSKGAKPIYINGAASSSSNYDLKAGSYLVFYDGSKYYFRTDGLIPGHVEGSSSCLKNPRSNTNANDLLTASNPNTLTVDEISNGASNIPSSHYYHIISSQGSDTAYQCQLALGMTIQKVFYRIKDAGTWQNWVLLNSALTSKSFQISLSGASNTGTVYTYKVGRFVQLTISWTSSVPSANTLYTIATLDDAINPIINTYVVGYCIESWAITGYNHFIIGSKKIQMTTSRINYTERRISVSYIADNDLSLT